MRQNYERNCIPTAGRRIFAELKAVFGFSVGRLNGQET